MGSRRAALALAALALACLAAREAGAVRYDFSHLTEPDDQARDDQALEMGADRAGLVVNDNATYANLIPALY